VYSYVLGIDLEEDFADFEMLVGTILDRHFDHATPNRRQYRRDRVINARICGKRVVVGHRDKPWAGRPISGNGAALLCVGAPDPLKSRYRACGDASTTVAVAITMGAATRALGYPSPPHSGRIDAAPAPHL